MREVAEFKPVIVGIDHGYGNMKTAHRAFRSGVDKLQTEAIAGDSVLVYKGVSYAIGESHLAYVGNRTNDEDAYILTLAALGEELLFRGFTEANVILGVGLPLARVATMKKDFKKYLMSDVNPEFEYKGKHFRVHIENVFVFPQCAAEMATISDLSGENIVIDIGNGTMNMAKVIDCNLVEKDLDTQDVGVSQCVLDIQKALSRTIGRDVKDSIIEQLLISGCDGKSDEIARVTKELAAKYSEEIIKKGVRYGYIEGDVKLHIFGGGGCILRNFSGLVEKAGVFFYDDICANAKGYELSVQLKLEQLKRKKNAS